LKKGGRCPWQPLSKKPQCNLKLQLAIKHGSPATKDAHLVFALEIYGTAGQKLKARKRTTWEHR